MPLGRAKSSSGSSELLIEDTTERTVCIGSSCGRGDLSKLLGKNERLRRTKKVCSFLRNVNGSNVYACRAARRADLPRFAQAGPNVIGYTTEAAGPNQGQSFQAISSGGKTWVTSDGKTYESTTNYIKGG